MRKLLLSVLIISFVASLALFAGCGGGAVKCKPADIHDTAENHYFGARRSLSNASSTMNAQAEFERAICLDAAFAPSYEGLGYYYFTQNNFALAKENLNLCLTKEPSWVPAYTCLGRIAAAEGNYADAYSQFDKALSLQISETSGITDRLDDRTAEFHSEAKYYKGLSYQDDGKLDNAKAIFTELREDKDANEYKELAKTAWLENQEMAISAKGLSAAYKAVVTKAEVTREELAAVLLNELPKDKIIKNRLDGDLTAEITDIDNSWAKAEITDAVSGKLMRVAPNGAFDPARTITKAEFAQAILYICANYKNDDAVLEEYVSENTPFYDVTKSHFAYNAIMHATRKGLLSPDKGTFDVNGKVSGDDLFWTISKLAEKLK